MKVSRQGLMAIASHEGIVLNPYKDSVGVWTIGIGHTAAAGNPDPKTFRGELSVSECFSLFRLDIAKYEAGVNKAVKVPLKQYEFDALVSFHYNTGAIGKAGFVRKLNAGDRRGAIMGIMDWKKPPEIIGRRTSERNLFRDGKYPVPAATIYRAIDGKVQWNKGQSFDLRQVLSQPETTTPEPSIPKPLEPETEPETTTHPNGLGAAIGLALAGLATAAGGAAAYLANIPCEYLGVLCQ